MNSVERISRLQTLLTRVQKRAKEERVPAPAAVSPAPAAAAPIAAPVAVAAPVAPVAITAKEATPKPPVAQPELEKAAAVFVPAASPVATDTTLPFSARVAPEVIARAGMKSPLGSEPPVAREEPTPMRTEPAPAPTRESGPPEIELGEAEQTISEAPSPKLIEVTPEPPTVATPRAAAMSELDFADLESPEPLEAGKPEEAEEPPPASSKRPSLHARELAAEPERPITTPPESGPQEVSAAELGAAAKTGSLEVDLALKQARVPREATIEQLGNTVELEAATDEALELAPTEAPVVRTVETPGEMEAEIPASIPPGVYGPDVAHVHIEPAVKPAVEAEKPAAAQAPAVVAQTPAGEIEFELEEIGPVSERTPTVADTAPVSEKTPVSVELPLPEVAVAAAAKGEEREPITAVRLIVPAPKAEPVPITIEVKPVIASGAVLDAEAAAFVGATRSFEPGSFLELLDATLSLKHSS